MGGLGGLIGTAGGAGGTGFSKPDGASIVAPTNAAQLTLAQKQNQDALAQQQALLTQLQAQNGLQNQSNVYGQLQNIAAGKGPNPAAAMLAQSTGQNVANQAAAMAGQRGSNANAGLIARQAAMAGSNAQQQAAGQAATLQANQSLNALSSAGNMANNMVSNQVGQVNANQSAAQNAQSAQMNAANGLNSANVGMQSNINNVNGQLANTQLQGQQAIIGGMMQGASSMGSMMAMADGGEIPGDSMPDAPSDAANSATSSMDSAPVAEPDQNNANEFKSATSAPSAENTNLSNFMTNVATPTFIPDAGAADLKAGFAGKSSSGGGGGGGGGMGGMAMLAMLANGGDPAKGRMMAEGGDASGPQSGIARFMNGIFGEGTKNAPNQSGAPQQTAMPNYGNYGANELAKGMSSMTKSLGSSGPASSPTAEASQMSPAIGQSHYMSGYYAKGGKVPALLSPGERYLPPKDVQKAKAGANPMKLGEKIPGKPKVDGPVNSYANDTVKKTLEGGGLVLPRSVTQSKHPQWAAHKFVQAHMMANGGIIPSPKKKAGK